jgi:hypothetical protein
MSLSQTAQRAIDAYGGSDLWKNYKFIEAEVSVKGLAFTLKRRPFFKHAKIKMEIARPFSVLTPIGKGKFISGILDGKDVRIENSDGQIIAERKNARDFFPYGRRLFYWDDLDMAYFSNYAFWNYFTLPNLLFDNRIEWTEKVTGVLSAVFPESIPTHSRNQEFYFDIKTGLLSQHNYTADIISKLANAANVVREHKKYGEVIYPSSRLVTPKSGNGKALKGPTLIDIIVHNFKLTNNVLKDAST